MNLQGWRYYVVGRDTAVSEMMNGLDAIPTGMKEADIVVFTGGTDISPTIYGEQIMHPPTQKPDTERDRLETALFRLATQKKKTVVGICRGAQLLNCLNGGKLYQHVTHHGNTTHPIKYIDASGESRSVMVTSDHHQMMRAGMMGVTLGYTKLSSERHTGVAKFYRSDIEIDPEIIWYRTTKSLCYQPHPEWGLVSDKNLFVECVRRTIQG